MAFHGAAIEFHTGEQAVRSLFRVPGKNNPTRTYLIPNDANILAVSPLMALGTLDSDGRPWTSLWGGEAGFSRPIAQSLIGVKTTIDQAYDPVAHILLGNAPDGEVMREKGAGRMVSLLPINLETRRRLKLYGRMVAGAIGATEPGIGEAQLIVNIEQALGNCPKYLNKRHIIPHIPQPKLISSDIPLPQAAIDLILKADLFFISSSNHESDMDTNHRGGPPGFVRILSNDNQGLTLVYPEYSGNRLYQTLGNLNTTPRAGLVFPDLDTGNVVYITGTTEILAGTAATNLISHTNLAVKIRVEKARFVLDGLAFRGQPGEFSPYNPPVRYLSTEKPKGINASEKQLHAKLIDRKIISPTIGRFRFRIADPAKTSQWKPGQWVALSFKDELDMGYSHMRDDDPKSLNDDFLRTFTVSSRQDSADSLSEFEITIRKVGVATDFLFRYNLRSELEVPLQGFGGEFYIQQVGGESISFVAGGVGITPLLAQAADLDLNRLNLYWTIRADDIAVANDTFDNIPGLLPRTNIFITGKIDEGSDDWKRLCQRSLKIHQRRMSKEDVSGDAASKWFACMGTSFRDKLVEWLNGKPVIYEDFNY